MHFRTNLLINIHNRLLFDIFLCERAGDSGEGLVSSTQAFLEGKFSNWNPCILPSAEQSIFNITFISQLLFIHGYVWFDVLVELFFLFVELVAEK